MVDFDCPTCDADASQQFVAADHIVCGSCRTSRSFRCGGLCVISGSPGTGKSSVGRALAPKLPLDLVVLDSDLTARREHDSSLEAWLGFVDTLLRTAVGMAQGGHELVLVGYSTPEQWECQPLRHFLGPITSIALVCSDDELDRRLRERTWIATLERQSLVGLNREFRARTDMTVIETDNRAPDVIADHIVDLLQRTRRVGEP